MALERIIVAVFAGPALLVSAAPAVGGPREPLIVTQMPDPDPYFVSSEREAKRGGTLAAGDAYDDSRIDEAMQTFGRAVGEAAMVEQQQIEAKCRQSKAETATPEQRYAWAASCRYSRH